MTKFWKGFAASYLLWAGVAGFAMKATIPPLNPLGIAYVGLTSPIMMACIAVHSDCGPIPPQQYSRYLFSFQDQPA